MAPIGTLPTDGHHDGSWRKGAEGGGSLIEGHPFKGVPRWGRCKWLVGIGADVHVCGLSEAAHAASATPYVPDAPRAVA